MEDLEKNIKDLGLSEKQAKIYLALLELGMSSAHSVARRSQLKRPTTYVILDELIGLGIASLIPRSKKKLYRALHPQILIDKRKKDVQRAEKALPEIEALMRSQGLREKPTVLFYEGVDGMNEVLNYKLEEFEGKELPAFFATSREEVQEMFGYFDNRNNRLRDLGVKIRGIGPDDPVLEYYREKDDEYERDMKILPKDAYSSEVAIEIGKTHTKIYDLDNLQGLIIENPAIAKTMREIFELVWEKY